MRPEQIQSREWPAALQPVEVIFQKIERDPPVKLLACSIGAVMLVGSLTAIGGHSEAAILKPEVSICADTSDCEITQIVLPKKIPQPIVKAPVKPRAAVTTQPSPTSTKMVAKLVKPRLVAQHKPKPILNVETVISPEQLRAIQNIEKMKLSREELAKTLANINTEYYNYAQSKPKFQVAEMRRQGINQGKTIFTTEHVSAAYYNMDGTVTNKPVGTESNIKLFIDKIIAPNGDKCCAVNQFIDRNAVIYWTAPRSAKLRHNKGYDGQTTGKEIEGYLNQDLTVEQLTASAYLDIGNLYVEKMLGKRLESTIRGHADTRTKYNLTHNDQLPVKIDWPEVVTDPYRDKIKDFLRANPDLAKIIPREFINLP